MKCFPLCQNVYACGMIMVPFQEVFKSKFHEFLWYIPLKILHDFPFKSKRHVTSTLDLQLFRSDAIFIPGNEAPYYLRDPKVQIHGLAGEKKGYFCIRNYFNLHPNQGSHIRRQFNELKAKFNYFFDVIDTGRHKLGVYGNTLNLFEQDKEDILKSSDTDKTVLFTPPFSLRFTTVFFLLYEIERLVLSTCYVIFIKFYNLMDTKWSKAYKNLSQKIPDLIFQKKKNIIKFLLQADILISDTSSVIYEFPLLDKPLISFKNMVDKIQWDNSRNYTGPTEKALNNVHHKSFKSRLLLINQEFPPYRDDNSAQRTVNTVKDYNEKTGVPRNRWLSLSQKLKIHNIFGKPSTDSWDGNKKNKITALLITYNEVNNIEAVIENIAFADEIIVVDSNSTDGTIDIIKEHPNVKLIQRPFKNYTDQKAFAMEQASNDWILFMDADERLTNPLKNEILKTVNSESGEAVAYMFVRTFMFKDKVLRFSGWQSDKNYRLFRKSKVHFTRERIVHETLIVNGKSGVLKNKLIHYSYKNYEDYKSKMIKYGQMKALEELKKDYAPNIYHFLFRPFYKFFNHYILRLGILDGKKGIIICYLNALGVWTRYKELRRLVKEKKARVNDKT